MMIDNNVYRQQINRLLSMYSEELYNQYGNRFLTPALQVLIERHLLVIQAQKQREEPQNKLYRLPVHVVFNIAEHRFDVVLTDEHNNNPNDHHVKIEA